jgi:hypothetical protein
LEKGLELTLFPDGSGPSPSSFALNASGNTFIDLRAGIDTYAHVSGGEAYTHTANISDNDFVDNRRDYVLSINGDVGSPPGEVDVDVTVQNNRSVWGGALLGQVIGVGEVAVQAADSIPVFDATFVSMRVDPIPDGHIEIDVVDNQVLDARADAAIGIGVLGGPDVDATIARNEILGVNEIFDAFGGIGIAVGIADSGDEDGHVVTINDNVIGGTDGEGINAFIAGGLNADVTVAGNRLSLIDSFGIDVFLENVGAGDLGGEGNTVTIERNILEDIALTGIDVLALGGDDTEVTVVDNSVSFVEFGGGIEVGFLGVGDAAAGEGGNAVTINRNSVEFTEFAGIDVNVAEFSDDTAVTVADNNLSFIDSIGISVDLFETGHDVGNAIAIDRNTLEFIGWDGIEVGAFDNFDTTLGMAGNDLSNIDLNGIDVVFAYNGAPGPVGNMITINGGNTIAFADTNGIAIDVFGFADGDTEVTVANNTVEHVGTDGIDIDFFGVTDGVITVRSNVVDGSDFDGIDIDLRDAFIEVVGSRGNEVNIASNQVSNSQGDGVAVRIGLIDFEDFDLFNDSGANVVTVQSNQISNSSQDGVDINVYDSDLNVVTLATNQITNSDSDGVDIDVYSGWDLDGGDLSNSVGNIFVVDTNTISLSDNDGIEINVFDALSLGNTMQVGGNSINLSGGDGIDVDSLALDTILSSEFTGVLRNNIVTNSTDLDAEITGAGTGTLLVNGTEVGFP